jgi:CubicO group peptidase (beta-lactamase class C family)
MARKCPQIKLIALLSARVQYPQPAQALEIKLERIVYKQTMYGFIFAINCIVGSPSYADSLVPAAAIATAPAPTASPAEQTLPAFVDGLAQAMLKRDHLAGISVSVTRRDQLLLQRGFGISAMPDKPVDPAKSLFRVGSLSKLFTYISAMQLVEQGKLDLDKPANAYLPDALKIPADGQEGEVLVRDLMRHTAGFEDLALGHLFVVKPMPVLTLDDYLAQHRPRRVRAPGQVAVYSNYSVALLGSLVAHVSGQAFEDYVELHVLAPLGMLHSTFREPIDNSADPRQMPQALRPDVSEGMSRAAGVFVPQKFEHIAQIAPAGGLSSTAADMAMFAQALLGNGTARILQPNTLQLMQSSCFENAAQNAQLGVQPICGGFLTQRFGKHMGYGHGGATVNFHTAFITIPELNLGVFVSINTDNGREPAQDFARLIVEHLAADAAPVLAKAISVDSAETAAVVGDYLSNRRPYFGLQAFLESLQGTTVSKADQSGMLNIDSSGDTDRYAPIAKLTYQNQRSGAIVRFIANAKGGIDGLASGSGISTSMKLGLWNAPILLAGLLAVIGSLGLLTLFSAYADMHSNRRPGQSNGLGFVKKISIFNAVLALLMVILFGFTAAGLSASDAFYHYPSPAVKMFLWVLPMLALLALVRLALVWRVLKSDWSRLAKLGYLISVSVFVLFALQCWHWGLLSLQA